MIKPKHSLNFPKKNKNPKNSPFSGRRMGVPALPTEGISPIFRQQGRGFGWLPLWPCLIITITRLFAVFVFLTLSNVCNIVYSEYFEYLYFWIQLEITKSLKICNYYTKSRQTIVLPICIKWINMIINIFKSAITKLHYLNLRGEISLLIAGNDTLVRESLQL